MHLKKNVALLQTKGLVLMIYSGVVCMPDMICRSYKSGKGNELMLDAWPVCSAKDSVDCNRHTTQNSLGKKWNYKDLEGSREERMNQAQEKAECRRLQDP